MDRFEVSPLFCHCFCYSQIYIPVWIDLKELFVYAPELALQHLHSSMDRFEVLTNCNRYGIINYLHSSMDRFEAVWYICIFFSCSDIYIPVWIDLKFRPPPQNKLERANLHSSMDRFEDVNAIINNYPLVHLHSSMDRFEETATLISISEEENLHSSMDRFEVLQICHNFSLQSIYIPVWIDLKFWGIPAHLTL